MKLIEKWRAAHTLLSVQVSAVGAAAATVWMSIPESAQAQLIEQLGQHSPTAAVIVGFLGVILARLVRQR